MSDRSPSAALNALTLERNIPVSVTVELTRRCPLSCLHCYLPETRGRAAAGPELDTRQWAGILRQLAGAGALYLVFTGGEPLLRPDLPELCSIAKKLNFDVRIFSTGLGLTAGLAARLKASGVSAFELSFYGRPAAHDAVTGLEGSFRRSFAAARLVKRAGLAVKIKMPLMKKNVSQAAWLEKLAEKEAFGISFDPVITPANDGNKSALPLRLSGPRLAKAVKLYGGSLPYAASPGAVPSSADFLCGAGRNVCAVGPDGLLYPCLQLPVALGCLTREKFSRLWKNSGWLKNWRSAGLKDLEGCSGCRDLAFCSRCPGVSFVEEGDVFAPNKPACEMAAITRSLACNFDQKPRA